MKSTVAAVTLSMSALACAGQPATSASEPADVRPAGWQGAAPMQIPRESITTAVLDDGRVLVLGGHRLLPAFAPEGVEPAAPYYTAEIYDPRENVWTRLPDMLTDHAFAPATVLPDGNVLVAGGFTDDAGQSADAEVLDVDALEWRSVEAMSAKRQAFTLQVLPNGRVLAAGGFDWDTESTLDLVEVLDPVTGVWSRIEDLPEPRSGYTTHLSGNELTLMGGCSDGDVCAVLSLDLSSGEWRRGIELVWPPGPVAGLPDGRFLTSGGRGDDGVALTEAAVLDLAAGAWTPTGEMGVPRSLHTLTLLEDGRVLAVGGSGPSGYETHESVEIWDPESGAWTPTDAMAIRRQLHSVVPLPNGDVLAVGGYNHDVFTAVTSCERFVPPR